MPSPFLMPALDERFVIFATPVPVDFAAEFELAALTLVEQCKPFGLPIEEGDEFLQATSFLLQMLGNRYFRALAGGVPGGSCDVCDDPIFDGDEDDQNDDLAGEDDPF